MLIFPSALYIFLFFNPFQISYNKDMNATDRLEELLEQGYSEEEALEQIEAEEEEEQFHWFILQDIIRHNHHEK